MNIRGITHRIKGFGETHHKPGPIGDFYIDSPHSLHVGSKTVHVEGWLIPTDGFSVRAVRVINNNVIHSMTYGKARPDVSRSHPGSSADCGFETDVVYEDGDLSIEADLGNGFESIYTTKITYSPEVMVDMLLNPRLAEYAADHENLLAAKKSYYYEPNNPAPYTRKEGDVKLVAFYLPQFHPIAVNDEVWGLGFTEWTNVTKAVPRFVGHQQPLLPGGLGFYDLRLEKTIKQQIELAKSHGIYGFCFYYYWFSGKKILETPLETVLKHKEWDFNFTICWANENWTKKWDGRDNDVILSQEYHKDDPLNFIKDVAPILNDPRYITKDGKPILVVYRASELKEPKRYAKIWRDYFKKEYQKELYLVSSMGFEINDPREDGFDIGLDFSPQTNFFKSSIFEGGQLPSLNQKVHYLDPTFNGSIVRYGDTALNKQINTFFDFPTINSIVPSWDNDARKNGSGFVMYGSNPDHYQKWLERTIRRAYETQGDNPFVFLNAWNEWAEGAILEPTRSIGYANLNRTSEALLRHVESSSTTTAVIIHISAQADVKDLSERLKPLLGSADIYITAIAKYEASLMKLQQLIPEAIARVVPNRGRDIFPFFFTAGRLKKEYKQLLKLSIDDTYDQQLILEKLLPSAKKLHTMFAILDSDNTAIIAATSTSFWTSAYYLAAVKNNPWIIEDFRPEVGQKDEELVVDEVRNISEILETEKLTDYSSNAA